MKKSLHQPSNTSSTNIYTNETNAQTDSSMNIRQNNDNNSLNNQTNYENYNQQQQKQHLINTNFDSQNSNFQYLNDEIDIDDIDDEVLDRLLGEYSIKSLIM